MRERKAARLARRCVDGHGEVAGSRWRMRAYRQLTEAAGLGDLVAARALATVGGPERGMLDIIWAQVPPPGCVADGLGRAVSLLVVDPDPDVLTTGMRDGIAVAAALEHPVADIARTKLLAHLDQELVDQTCRVAEEHPQLAEFCRQHQLAPADPSDHTRYLLLTDQFSQYQALDPDGALLTGAYDAAADGVRASMRAAALRHGAVDVVQTLTHRRQAHAEDLSTEELTRLSRTLADRGDWPRLWDVVTDVPAVDAAFLAALFPTSWQPDETPERRLLAALRDAESIGLAMLADSSTLVCLIDPARPVDGIALAPDLSQVAMETMAEGNSYVSVYDVATESPRGEYPTSRYEAPLAHLGDGVLVAMHDGLCECTSGRTRKLATGRVNALAAAAGRYVAWTDDQVLFGCTAEPDPARKAIPDYGAHLRLADDDRDGLYVASAAPDGNSFAIGCGCLDRPTGFVVVDDTGEVLADSGPLDEPLDGIAFSTPHELVTLHAPDDDSNGTLRRWRIDGGRLHEQLPRYTGDIEEAVGLPGQGWLAITEGPVLRFLDAGTLEERPEHEVPEPLRQPEGNWLSSLVSVGGYSLAFVVHHGRIGQANHTSTVELHDLRRPQLARLLTTPISQLSPTDVGALAGYGDHDDEPTVRLLRACLQYRFGTDVTVGESATPRDRSDVAVSRGAQDET